jgi:AcrR family transcriptional regulator
VQRVSRDGDLTTEELVKATLALIDELGVDAVTMRALANKIGTSPMAPYRHVSNKQVLLELAADVIYGGIATPDRRLDPWARIKALFEAILDLSDRYPWTVDVLFSRELALGSDPPNVRRVRDLMHELLGDLGLNPKATALAAETAAELITGSVIQKKLRAQRRTAPNSSAKAEAVNVPPAEPDIRAFTLVTFLNGLRASLNTTGPTSSQPHRRPTHPSRQR